MADPIEITALAGATFGRTIVAADAEAFVAWAEAEPPRLPDALGAGHGLLVIEGLHAIVPAPELLLRLSRLFGGEVENYRATPTEPERIHPQIPEILVLSNAPPHNVSPPARPDPPRRADGGLPTRFPHRRGWHTDQSFRRPPPDVSLFYAVVPAPPGEGQTLFADGIAAYASLPRHLADAVETLEGLHVIPGSGRSEYDVRAGRTPRELRDSERPQRQPVVRIHPETGAKALYLCEAGQMDWVDGPLVGMQSGIHGDGAKLLYELMAHYTADAFTYAHEWQAGDLVVYDNRCTIHSATWFDAERHERVMWRTTVWGNPGPHYAGERRSWMVA